MIDITFSSEATVSTGPLCLPLAKGTDPREAVAGPWQPYVENTLGRFAGDAGTLAEFTVIDGGTPRRVVLFGTGEDGKAIAQGAAALVERFVISGETALHIDLRAIPAEDRAKSAATAAEALRMRSWRHERHRTTLPELKRTSLASAEFIMGESLSAISAEWPRLAAICEGVAFARALVSEPGNLLHPQAFVDECRALEALGVEVEVLDEVQMQAEGMGALLAVGRGSAQPPRLLVMRWRGTEDSCDASPLALIGKGVTFDTGGISIKPSAGMEAMKWDMGGAASVAGTIKSLALRKAGADVVGICALAENMPDGNAMRPGDVVTTMAGKTVEIINTDAEGRLVLADALTYAQRRFGTRRIVDLATLTGAIVVSLGHEFAGLFSPDRALAEALLDASSNTGERLWQLPLDPAFDALLESSIADMKNIGGAPAGASTAAHFLGRFIEEGVEWAHLDIAGMAWTDKPQSLCDKGATGFGVRLLDFFIGQ